MSPHIIRLAKAVTITPRTDIEVVRLVEAVKADQPQIIRTIEELEALDPDTQLGRWYGETEPSVMVWFDWMGDWGIDGDGIFPLAVVATGEQIRTARKALGEA